jgi:hypothetical protein
MKGLVSGMGWADGRIVAIGHAAVGAMIGGHGPWTLVAAMLHAW